MVLGIKAETLDDMLIILAAVFIFNSLPLLQGIGPYFQKSPILILVIGIAIIAFRKKISSALGE